MAIVGAGPAGLSAAYYLSQYGHECHLYDSNEKPGGQLQHGVPADKLPRPVLDAEIEQILILGVEFRNGQSLGKDFSLSELQVDYDAVVLALGTIKTDMVIDSELEYTTRGIAVDRNTFETSITGIFAGGNAISEGRMAIRSAAHGKFIAHSVNRYIDGWPLCGYPHRFNSVMGKLIDGEGEEFIKEAETFNRIEPSGGLESGYTVNEAINESKRCFHCDCRKPESCKLRRYADEYGADRKRFNFDKRKPYRKIVQHNLIVFEPGKCIKCNICVGITEKAGEKLGLTFINGDSMLKLPFLLMKRSVRDFEKRLKSVSSLVRLVLYPCGTAKKDNIVKIHKSLCFIIALLCLICNCSGKKDTEHISESPEEEIWPIFRGDRNLSGVADAQISDTMNLLWSFKTGGAVISSPVIDFGSVFIGSTDGKVYAIGLRNGSKIWEYDTGDDIEASPMLLDKTLYIGNLSGNFFALDVETGKVVWQYEIGSDIMGSANWVDVPGSSKKLVLVGSYDTKMYCFDSDTGSLKWTYETNYYINGTPATDGQNVVFGGCDEQLHIVSAIDGTKKGAVAAGSYIAGSAALVDNRAYIGHYGGQLVCIDVNEQKIVWKYGDRESGREFFSSPAVGKDRVLIGSRDNYIHCVDRGTGQLIWKFQTRGEVDSSPVIVKDKVVFGSADGSLYMVGLEDGKMIRSYEIGASITGSPAVINGMIVTGAEDGRIYAFGEKS